MESIERLLNEYRNSYHVISDNLYRSGLSSRKDIVHYYCGDMSQGGRYARAVMLNALDFIHQYQVLNADRTLQQVAQFKDIAVNEFTSWWLYRHLPNVGYRLYRTGVYQHE